MSLQQLWAASGSTLVTAAFCCWSIRHAWSGVKVLGHHCFPPAPWTVCFHHQPYACCSCCALFTPNGLHPHSHETWQSSGYQLTLACHGALVTQLKELVLALSFTAGIWSFPEVISFVFLVSGVTWISYKPQQPGLLVRIPQLRRIASIAYAIIIMSVKSNMYFPIKVDKCCAAEMCSAEPLWELEPLSPMLIALTTSFCLYQDHPLNELEASWHEHQERKMDCYSLNQTSSIQHTKLPFLQTNILLKNI